MSQLNYTPLFRGTGDMLLDGTIGNSFRIQLFDTVRQTIGTNAVVTAFGSFDHIAAFVTNTVILQINFDLQQARGGSLDVGVDPSSKNRTVELTISAGTNIFACKFRQVLGAESFGGKNPKLIRDGGMRQVGGAGSNPSALKGMSLTYNGGLLMENAK